MEPETSHEDILDSIESLRETALRVKRERDMFLQALQAIAAVDPDQTPRAAWAMKHEAQAAIEASEG